MLERQSGATGGHDAEIVVVMMDTVSGPGPIKRVHSSQQPANPDRGTQALTPQMQLNIMPLRG